MTDQIVCSGALFYAKNTKRILLLRRSPGKNGDSWGLVGGGNEEWETPWEGLQREILEEIGFVPDIIKTIPLETFVSRDTKFNFHTYFCVIEDEFIPLLNHEHTGYAWCTLNKWPKPLHHGLRNTFQSKINSAKIETIVSMLDFLDK